MLRSSRVVVRCVRNVFVLALGAALACGGDRAPAAQAQDQPGSGGGGGAASATLQLGTVTYTFPGVRCDLEDARGDGNLVFGVANNGDGQRMRLEVERLKRGEILHERITIYFGSVTDGDFWTARGDQWPDGRWFANDGAMQLDGPLLEVTSNGVAATGVFHHETADSTRNGTFRAVCG
jgi:hypothetical protein